MKEQTTNGDVEAGATTNIKRMIMTVLPTSLCRSYSHNFNSIRALVSQVRWRSTLVQANWIGTEFWQWFIKFPHSSYFRWFIERSHVYQSQWRGCHFFWMALAICVKTSSFLWRDESSLGLFIVHDSSQFSTNFIHCKQQPPNFKIPLKFDSKPKASLLFNNARIFFFSSIVAVVVHAWLLFPFSTLCAFLICWMRCLHF